MCVCVCILLVARSQLSPEPYVFVWYLCAEEEPYLIFANRYYLRKLNLDGSNYTLIKQVRHTGSPFDLLSHNKVKLLLLVLRTPVKAMPASVSGSE